MANNHVHPTIYFTMVTIATQLYAIAILFPSVAIELGTGNVPVTLEEASTVFLPFSYENDTEVFRYHAKAAVGMAYDKSQKKLYVTGSNILTVIDISNVNYPRIIHRRKFPDTEVTDVALCPDHVVISLNNLATKKNGQVKIFRKHSAALQMMEIYSIDNVGVNPKEVKGTRDCSVIVVAVEGPAYSVDGHNVTDPEGSIGLITFPLVNMEYGYIYKKLDFTPFQDSWQVLEQSGVRFVYRDGDQSIINDLEPESIALNDNETTAFVSLQQNNAIAIVDLALQNITDIKAIGLKDWTQYKMDASDLDYSINMRQWPVYGLLQPDTIETVTISNREYLLSANEGKIKTILSQETIVYSEEEKVSNLNVTDQSEISSWLVQNNLTEAVLKSQFAIGDLKVSKHDGYDGVGHKRFYSYGGRGFSLLDSDTMATVYDSGSLVEETIRDFRPTFFNADSEDKDTPMANFFDKHSDRMGPQCETLTHVTTDDEKLVVFLGVKNPGAILVLSVNDTGSGSGLHVSLESVWTGIPDLPTYTLGQLYQTRKLTAVGPKDLIFLSATDSPSYSPLLLVAGATSGTVSILHARGLGTPPAL